MASIKSAPRKGVDEKNILDSKKAHVGLFARLFTSLHKDFMRRFTVATFKSFGGYTFLPFTAWDEVETFFKSRRLSHDTKCIQRRIINYSLFITVTSSIMVWFGVM